MINLLPPEARDGYRYARRNVGLRRWAAACLIALVGLGALATYGLLTIQQSTTHYNSQIASSNALFKQENFNGTESQVQDITSSLRLAVKVLSNEVLFSQMLKQISTIVPNGVNLTGLTVSQGQTSVDVAANAASYSAATQLQVNLADPANKIFSKADIVSIDCSSGTGAGTTTTTAGYPCSVTIQALFAANNPFLFINSKGTSP